MSNDEECRPTWCEQDFLPHHETPIPLLFFPTNNITNFGRLFLKKRDKIFKMDTDDEKVIFKLIFIFDGPSVTVEDDHFFFKTYIKYMTAPKPGFSREFAEDEYRRMAEVVCGNFYVLRRDPRTLSEIEFHLTVFRSLCRKHRKFVVVGRDRAAANNVSRRCRISSRVGADAGEGAGD
jgi:hypothetical protein